MKASRLKTGNLISIGPDSDGHSQALSISQHLLLIEVLNMTALEAYLQAKKQGAP